MGHLAIGSYQTDIIYMNILETATLTIIIDMTMATDEQVRIWVLFCPLQEMLCELFTPVETPEAPNRGFFKGLFGGGAQSLDREDLCESRNITTSCSRCSLYYVHVVVFHYVHVGVFHYVQGWSPSLCSRWGPSCSC